MQKHTLSQAFSSQKVDHASGTIRGVAVITEGPAIGHFDAVTGKQVMVDHTTLLQIMECAKTYTNGLKVKADHRSGIFAVSGYLDNFRIDGKTLRADLHALASDDNRDKLLEMAATIPDTFGLSVSFSGADEVRGDKCLSRCTEIYSADLVSEPAANPNGLFSQGVDQPTKGKPMDPEIMKQCEAMINKFAAEFNAKFSALEAKMPKSDAVDCADYAATKKTVTELEAKIVEMGKNALTVESVAKEFSKVIGTSPVAPVSPASAAPSNEPKPAELGQQLVQKHFAATKSKTKALELAAKENSKAVEALVKSGSRIVYEIKAA